MSEKVYLQSDEKLQDILKDLRRQERDAKSLIKLSKANADYYNDMVMAWSDELGDVRFSIGSVRNELKKRGQINE